MKRYLICGIALSFTVLFVGCGTKTETTAKNPAGQNTATAPETAGGEAKTVEEKPSVDATKIGYSVDMVANTAAGEQTSRMMVGGKDKVRIEMTGQIIIVRKDKGKTWMLMPSTKTAMEMPIDEQMLKEIEKAEVAKSKLKPVGEETVDGYLCDKYLVTEKGTKATTWIAKENGLPIKVESAGATVIFKNIKVGKQPDSLFELDPGYKIQAMPDMSQMQRNMPAPR